MAKDVPVRLNIVALDRASAPLKQVEQSLARFGAQAKRTETALESITRAQIKSAKSLKEIGGQIRNFGAAYSVGITAPIAAGATVGVMEFAKIQDALIDLKSELNPNTFGLGNFEEGFKKLQGDLRGLSLDTGIPTVEIIQAFDSIQDRTGNVTESLLRLQAATSLAKVKNASLAETTKGLNAVMQAYNIPASEAAATAGRFLAIANESDVSIETLTSGLSGLATKAAQFGIPFSEIAATLQVAMDAGMSTEDAFAGIDQMLKGFTKTTSKADAESKRLGVNFGTNALRANGLVGSFEKLSEAKNIEAKTGERLFRGDKAQVLAKILLEKKANALRIAHKNLGSSKEAEAKLTASLAAKQDGLSVASGKAFNALKLLMSNVFEPLAPILTVLAKAMKPIAKFFENHPLIAGVAGAFLLLLAAIGPLIIIVGQLAISLGGILLFMARWQFMLTKFPRLLGPLDTALKFVTRSFGFLIRALLNPMSIFTGLRVALAFLVQGFWGFMGILGTISVFLLKFVALPILLIAGFIAWGSAIYDVVTNLGVFWDALKMVYESAVEGFETFFNKFGEAEGLLESLAAVGWLLAAPFQALWNVLKGVYSEMVKITESGIGKLAGFFGLGAPAVTAEGAAPAAPDAPANDAAARVAQNQQRNVSTTNNASVDVNFRNLPKDARVSSEGGAGPFLLNLGLSGGY